MRVSDLANNAVDYEARLGRGQMRRVKLEEDLDGIVELARLCFGEEPAPERWKWKYSPPWAEGSYSWLGIYNDFTISHIGAVPLRGVLDGVERPFFQIADIMLQPTLRGKVPWMSAPKLVLKGIFDKLPDAVLYGFADRTMFNFYRFLGVASRVDEPREFIVRADAASGTAMDEGIEIREWDWTDPNIDLLWDGRKQEIRCGLIRDRQYLGWRYGTHPIHRYRLLGVYRRGEPVGWVVQLRAGKEQREERAWIMDLLLPRHLLLASLVPVARTLQVSSLSLWLPSSRRSEFGESRPSGMVLMSWKSSMRTEYFKNHHYYTAGDADIF